MKFGVRQWHIIAFFFKPYQFQCVVVFALVVISGFLETMNLAALYPIINYGLGLDKTDFLLQAFEKVTQAIAPTDHFWAACILLIMISVAAIISKLAYNYYSNTLLTRIIGDTQIRIFEKFIAADYSFYVKHEQGRLIYAGTTASERVTVAVLSTITLTYNVINSVFLFFLLVVLSWQATAFIVLLGLFYGVVIRQVMQAYIKKCASVSTEENQRKNIILNEFITGIKTIKIFLAIEEWKKRYVQSVTRGLANQFRILTAKFFPETFVKFLFYMLIALTGLFFSQKPHAEIMALLPMLGTFVLVVNRFLPSIYIIGNTVMNIAECMPGITIVHELCTQEFATQVEGAEDLNGFTNKITFEHVWFRHASMDDYLLKDLSFTIEKKKMTAIVGLSGSGKTTIVNLLLKLYAVDKGVINIDGKDIAVLSNASYLGKIGYVSQETFIFNNTIKENIRFGMDPCTDAMIEEAARLAHAHEFIMAAQHGYDTIVGDSGVKLSGGQRQRIAIARAMLRKPAIIVLDEATSSLDNISEKKIQKAINDISKHTTVLVVAHRLSTVQQADSIIILEHGQIKEQGTHDELMKNKKLYYDLHMSKDVSDGEFAKETIG